jgi:predicted flap endonuclease-1-like 5' DNA nuclease
MLGGKIGKQLKEAGIITMGEVQQATVEDLKSIVGD